MKIRFLVYILLLCCGTQKMYSQTELCIVGTYHDERKYINSDSIYNILLKIKPDVILIELDSALFTKDFCFDLKKYPDLLSTNENIGAEKYRSQFKVDLRPFDMTGRNEYYRKMDFFKNQNKMWNDVFQMSENNELSKKDKEDADLIAYALNLNNEMIFNSVKDLNSDMTMKFLSLREKIIYPKMVSIVENTEKLHHWIGFAREWENHWNKRNKIMADNIRIIASETKFKNKRIVVLVGLEHKPSILNLLQSSNKTDFTIKEY